MKQLTERPTPTDWRYCDPRLSHAEQFRRYVDFEAFRNKDSMQPVVWPVLLGYGLAVAVGLALFALVGVLAGFIEL